MDVRQDRRSHSKYVYDPIQLSPCHTSQFAQPLTMSRMDQFYYLLNLTFQREGEKRWKRWQKRWNCGNFRIILRLGLSYYASR